MNCIVFAAVAVLLLAYTQAFTVPSSNTLIRTSKKINFNKLYSEETDDEIRDRIRAKARKNLYNADGVPFAPWVTKQIDEDAIVEDALRKEKEKVSKKPASVLDRGEIEASEGMRWRMNGDQVDLGWVTREETDNKGYIIEKRPSYGGDFQEIASFREVSQLVSKGPNGGRYRYTDPSTNSGSWVYRVQDCDIKGNQNVICQCFVEVQSAAESKFQSIAAVGIVVFFAAAFAIGYSLDPQQ